MAHYFSMRLVRKSHITSYTIKALTIYENDEEPKGNDFIREKTNKTIHAKFYTNEKEVFWPLKQGTYDVILKLENGSYKSKLTVLKEGD